MLSGIELMRLDEMARKIGYLIGSHTLREENIDDIKKSFKEGLKSGTDEYETNFKIVNERDIEDWY